ncbi:hypothetical protein ACLMJK_008398 [Lecanora helva]
MAIVEPRHINSHTFPNDLSPKVIAQSPQDWKDYRSISNRQTDGAEKTQSIDSLTQLLAFAANSDAGLVVYTPKAGINEGIRTTYSQLWEVASEKAKLLHQIDGINTSSILLLHFDNHSDNILWFWAATLAGYLPAISTPLVNDQVQRKQHLSHLHVLLKDPIVLTKSDLLIDFPNDCELRLHVVEEMALSTHPSDAKLGRTFSRRADDLAVLMLTSGSTGNAKAVGLRHEQILTAIRGKSAHHGVGSHSTFLNWIGMDHVANLTEIHLQAMSLGAEQVHIQAADVLANPVKFLQLLETHKIEYTFAPNFFLAILRDTIAANPDLPQLDLSSLRAFISGGESNVVDTCTSLTAQLRRHGINDDIIRPGFGMTETCAGSIYSKACPSYDNARHLEFASLGSCIPGIKMRVVNEANTQVAPGEVGDLQVTGPVVFREYFNNLEATKSSFSADGWFISGDKAFLDGDSNLNLTGRSKDTIITNGVKFSSHELETAIDNENIAGIASSFTIVFPHRPVNSETEKSCVVYSPEYDENNAKARFGVTNAIAKIVGLSTGIKPAHILPLPKVYLEKTSLGKISRTKVKSAFESGKYQEFVDDNDRKLANYQAMTWTGPETETERSLIEIFANLLEMPSSSIDVNSSIFELGVTSFNLIAVKQQIQTSLTPDRDLSFGILLKEPSTRGIASAIDDELSKPHEYDPVVPLQTQGTKTPLWCIHPGSGDILVFIQLAQQFADRPVYALRTRGYNPGEELFSGPEEAADTYCKHIRLMQANGPYAIAGYSLGSTLAFEVAKRLRSQGCEVRFLASIDYPPFISGYVAHLDWIDVLLHISFFLELIDESTMINITEALHKMSRDEALDYMLEIADNERLAALACDKAKLALISDIGEAFRVGVTNYEPTAGVQQMDVFVADPPTYAAKNREDWRENRLGRWRELSDTEPIFHECLGIHAKMLNKEYIQDFSRRLKAAMRGRGV